MAKKKLTPEEKLGRRPWYEKPVSHRIHFALAEVARERGILVRQGPHKGKVNLQEVMRGAGVSYATAWMWLRRPEQMTGVTYDALVRLCEWLDCTPGDLLRLESAVDLPTTPLADKIREERTTAGVAGGPGAANGSEGEPTRYFDPQELEAEDLKVRW